MPTSSDKLQDIVWHTSRLAEAIELAARKSGFPTHTASPMPIPPDHLSQADTTTLGYWLEGIASRLHLEIEPVIASYGEVEQFLRRGGPFLQYISLTQDEDTPPAHHFLVVLRGLGQRVLILAPDGTTRRVPFEMIKHALCHHLETPLLDEIEGLLDATQVPTERRERARKAVLQQRLGRQQLSSCWIIRLPPGEHAWSHVRLSYLPSHAIAIVILHLIRKILEVVAWWVIGWGALQGRFDWGLLWAWVLLLLTTIPLQIIENWLQNSFAIRAGSFFKQRIIQGTLRLIPDEIRHQGVGQFLGRVMDMEVVEMLALDSGFRWLIGLVEIFVAALVLSAGAGGSAHALIFIAWVMFTLLLGWRYLWYNNRWTDTYREMTNDLVERMDGHRTRLAQEDRSQWHEQEDQQMARYIHISQQMDRIGLYLRALVPQGWLLLGFSGLVVNFVLSPASSTLAAISLGGILMASQALENLVAGMQSIINVIGAWEQVAPIYKAAARSTDEQIPDVALVSELAQPHKQTERETSLLVAHDIIFGYANRPQPVLNRCNLMIRHGDRVLLEGPSGSGKSTLGALMTGMRNADSGLLLLHGFDRYAIGTDEWQRRVVSAPQFHENHVFSETFAFNLLMGRGWPPANQDLLDAEDMCYELGLGNLLERMPAGLQQMVGEGGWQLSHGERSRLFIARALLQQADMIILDESFAALDPENLHRALQTVLKRAPALLVIAHP